MDKANGREIKKLAIALVLISVTLFYLISSCSSTATLTIAPTNSTDTLAPAVSVNPTTAFVHTTTTLQNMSVSPTLTRGIVNESETQTDVFHSNSPTPTITSDSIYLQIDDDFFTTREITQGPVYVETSFPPNETYLYRNTVVSFRIKCQTEGFAYVNLDNLADNGMGSSDLMFDVGVGNEIFPYLLPINHATTFLTYKKPMTTTPGSTPNAENSIGYNYCVNHLSDYGNNSRWGFDYNEPICVLTNEGRIALVEILKVDQISLSVWDNYFAISVTVYQKKPNLPD